MNMKILALDTSGSSISVAALDGVKLVCEIFEHTGLTHSQMLMPLVERALNAARWTVSDVNRIAVITGPGSFTGVRIGVASARAVAQAAGIQCVGVNALEAMAADLMFSGYRGVVCPMIDARAGQVYAAVFHSGESLTRLAADTACPLEYFLRSADAHIAGGDERIMFTGDASERMWDQVTEYFSDHKERAERAAPGRRMPRASAAGLLAVDAESVPYQRLLPAYLREPQAEREYSSRKALME